MKGITKKILPYLITSVLVIGYWKFLTWTANYAWDPKGKELLMLDISLLSIFFYKVIFYLVVANAIVFIGIQIIKKNYKTSGIGLVTLIAFYIFLNQEIDKKCAFFYYSVFHNQSRPETLLVKPIKEAGYHIGPILVENIVNKEMKYRRYAILGLQKINYEPAIPIMERILFDSSELEVYRADAYETLKYFDNERTDKLIEKFKLQARDSTDQKVIELGEYFYKNRDK